MTAYRALLVALVFARFPVLLVNVHSYDLPLAQLGYCSCQQQQLKLVTTSLRSVTPRS
jgi:hypothetical protein